jgi:hypothetical protein
MDVSSSWWAIQLGLILAAPFCLLVGTGFAFSTLTSPFHHPLAKLLGSVAACAIALFTGDLIRQVLAPFFWTTFGAIWFAGFGWLLCWVLISILGEVKDDDLLSKPERHSPFDPVPAEPRKNRPASPFRVVGKNKSKDEQ